MKIGDLIEIEWEDHCSLRAGWVEPDQISNTPVTCRTVGYVVKLSKKYITLTPTFDMDGGGTSGSSTRIRSCITKTKILKGL